MRTRAKTIAAAVGITALAVVGLDTYTYAGTGDSLLLGKLNKANKTTHVTSTGNGPALSLHAKGDRPALAVDSRAKIGKLNADRIDGKDAAALQNNVRVYTVSSGTATDGEMTFDLPNFPNGRYQVTYSVHMQGTSGSATSPSYGYCAFHRESVGPPVSGHTSASSVGPYIGLSASDVITNNVGDDWELSCYAHRDGLGDVNWSINTNLPVRMTLTRVDKRIGGNPTISRNAPNALPGR